MPKIDILLSTYNGALFLEEQLNSIINQTFSDWRLIVRDDCSTDTTTKIIKSFVTKYPDKIQLIEDDKKNLGASQSFANLLQHSTSDYIMFSDQDDIWLPDKIEITLKKIKEIEQKVGLNVPVLIHTDMKVVDCNLMCMAPSFWKYQLLDPKLNKINNLLVQNNVTGCTVMINKALKKICRVIPGEAQMHDWWLAMVASCFGKIDFLNNCTVLYRQHGKNDVGAKKWGINTIIQKVFNRSQTKHSIDKSIKQANAFLNQYLLVLNEREKQIIKEYASFEKYSFFKKRYLIFKHSFWKKGILRNLGLIVNI